MLLREGTSSSSRNSDLIRPELTQLIDMSLIESHSKRQAQSPHLFC